MRKHFAIVIAVIAVVAAAIYFARPSPTEKVPTDKVRSSQLRAAPTVTQPAERPAHKAATAASNAGAPRAATVPTTEEQHEQLVCNELANRRNAREQAARDAEPKDPAWAYPMEQKLREFTSRRFQTSELRVIEIDCRTTFCELSAQGFAAETNEEFNNALSAVREQPWNDLTGLAITNDLDSGKGLHSARLYSRVSRKQSNPTGPAVPDDMQLAVVRAETQALIACSERVYERQQRERAARDAEPRDASWADPLEQLLRQHITTQMAKHPVETLDISCRTTFCKIKASGHEAQSQLAFQQVAQTVGSEPWANLQNRNGGGGSDGDGWKEEYTLDRRSR